MNRKYWYGVLIDDDLWAVFYDGVDAYNYVRRETRKYPRRKYRVVDVWPPEPVAWPAQQEPGR